MAAVLESPVARKFWPTVLTFGSLHFLIMALGAPLIDIPQYGCMFVTPIYFIVLVVALPIARLRRFWAGTAVFLPYAIIGLLPTYYFEWLASHNLKGLWGVLAWCLIGPLAGLLGDLAYHLLPARLSESRRLTITGSVLGAAIYFTVLLALTTFYKTIDPASHVRYFVQGWTFSLPWMVVNGGFAGYTAHALTRPG